MVAPQVIPSVPVGEDVSATRIADLLLLAATGRRATAIIIEPGGSGHAITLELGPRPPATAALPGAVGDAVVARLALIAGLDLGAPEEQVGRIRVRVDAASAQFLVLVRATPDGLEAELRRVADSIDGAPEAAKEHEDHAADGDAPRSASRVGVYRLHGELGRGGMGIVYRAEHVALAKPVAIKVLHPEMAKDSAVAARFVREARAASRAHHPGIVTVNDFGTLPDGRSFLVMELIEWPTLETALGKGALAPVRAIAVARQIAAALDAAHATGVVHRDLKPANVFLSPDDRVKIGDFGAAKVVGSSSALPSDTQMGTFMGTPYYMSPEQAGGLSTDRRTDLYALGCTLFEMLMGRVPYDGDSSLQVLASHIADPVPSVQSPHGPLPDTVPRIIARAMAKRAEDRYQAAGEMIADLAAAAKALDRFGWRRWLPT